MNNSKDNSEMITKQDIIDSLFHCGCAKKTMFVSDNIRTQLIEWEAKCGNLEAIMLRAGIVIGRRKFQQHGMSEASGCRVVWHK